MNKLFVLSVSGLLFLATSLVNAASGEVTVSLEKSADSSTWDPTVEGVSDTSSAYYRASIVPVDGVDVTYSDVVQAVPSGLGNNVNVSLESSDDLSAWSDSVIGTYDVSGSKKFFRANVRSIYDDMVFVEGGTMSGIIDPVASFMIGRYEVSKEEWDVVYTWAIANGYTFFEGLPGVASEYGVGCAPNHPVTNFSWYDAVKWCNARSQKESLTPVYYTDVGLTSVYQSGNIDALYLLDPSDTTPGYRLLGTDEWEYAARGGVNSLGYTYSGGNILNEVAINPNNSVGAACPDTNGRGTWPLASKAPNELGIYDMSGNVAELVNVSEGGTLGNRNVRYRGGDYLLPLFFQPVEDGWSTNAAAAAEFGSWGFRLAKNIPVPSAAIVEASTAVKSTKKPKENKSLKASRR